MLDKMAGVQKTLILAIWLLHCYTFRDNLTVPRPIHLNVHFEFDSGMVRQNVGNGWEGPMPHAP